MEASREGGRPGEQRQLDFERAEQLGMLRNARLPAVQTKDGGKVSEATLKHVLTRIDDHGGGRESFVSFDTLAAETGLGTRTVKRAVEALATLSLLCVERRKTRYGVVCNHYRVVWSELALRCRIQEAPAFSPATKQVAAGRPMPALASTTKSTQREAEPLFFRSDQSATRTDQSATNANQSATMAHKAPKEAPKEAPPPSVPQTANFLSPPESPAVQAAWRLAAEQVSASGVSAVGKLIAEARAQGLTPDALVERLITARFVLEVPSNRRKLQRPTGAMVFFLLNGRWPVDGLTDPRDERRKPSRDWMSLRLTEIVQENRGAGDERIKELLRAELPEEFLQAEGWA